MGVYVIFGVLGMKIYVKFLFIICKEGDEFVCYVYIGTGNFYECMVCIYIDFVLFIVN